MLKNYTKQEKKITKQKTQKRYCHYHDYYLHSCSFSNRTKYLSVNILKYNGGGDWYSNPTSLPNLVEFCNQNLKTNIKKILPIVEVGSLDIFNYPFIHMTGHGNVIFSTTELII